MDLRESDTRFLQSAPARILALGVSLALVLAGGLVWAESGSARAGGISGMWVWSADAYQTSEQQTRLLNFCRSNHFNHLDVHVRIGEQEGKARLLDEKELAELLSRAAQAGVSVCALRGSPKMFFEENYARTLRELEVVIDFNNRLPARARFAGIKYDVEPQTLAEWRRGGSVREKIMRDYLGCLARIKEALDRGAPKAARMELSVDIPFWWDKGELRIEYRGQTRPFSEHVQDLADSVTLMAYRRDPETVKLLVESQRAYAARIGKSVLPALLHSKAASPDEGFLSFYGLPASEYLRVRRELEQWASGQPGIGGVMHHHYGSLSRSLE